MDLLKVQPFLSPEFDTRPGAAVERKQTYVVCSTPRSGSTFLCQALASTGVAGTPMEYFNPVTRSILSRRWGCGPGLIPYVESLKERRTSRTGILGIKLHWHQLEAIRNERSGHRRFAEPFRQPAGLLEDLLGARPAYVRLMRTDLDRQAISLWTAEYTRVWARAEESPGKKRAARVPYSFAGIDRCRARIALAEARWHRFFHFNGVEPTEVIYEDLCGSYAPTVAGVLDRLLPGAAAAGAPPQPIGAQMADARSEELLARFRSDLDRRSLEWLDRSLPWRVRARLTALLRRE
jgi:LPS sulfotransferase NodH